MKAVQISSDVDGWIRQEELAVRSNLKVVSKWDNAFGFQREDLHGEEEHFDVCDTDEADAYWEFIHWHMNKDHALVMSIKHKDKKDNWVPYEGDEALSFAFSSMDFQRKYGRAFDAYHYKVKKTYEKVKDLADTYSCISDERRKENIRRRYVGLVEKRFRNEAVELVKHYNMYAQWMDRKKALMRINDLNDKIKKCKEIWDRHAFQV